MTRSVTSPVVHEVAEATKLGDNPRMTTHRRVVAAALLQGLLAAAASGCRTAVPCPDVSGAARPTTPVAPSLSDCPAEATAPPQLPFARTVHSLPEFWISRLPAELRGVEVLNRQQIEAHNRTIEQLRKEGWPRGRFDLLSLELKAPELPQRLEKSLQHLREAVREGKRVLADGKAPLELLAALERAVRELQPASELRVAHRSAPLRCYPTDVGVYEKAYEVAFDLMQCAQLRPGEPVRVLGKGKTFYYVWSSYAEGWVRPEALTPALDAGEARAFLQPKRFVVLQRDLAPLLERGTDGAERVASVVRMGTTLPLLEQGGDRLKVSVPTAAGLGQAWLARGAGARVGFAPLTRQNLLERAFALLNAPYGWGGMGGHRDCSRLIMDLFASFGLELPRNSIRQSVAGTRQVEVEGLDEAAKIEAIQQVAGSAVVLLYLPGHIMLHLGRDGDQLYALHLFSGYLVPCDGKARTEHGRETMMRVNRVVVTSLELGRGSSRRSFLERITRLVLLEPPPAR